MRPGCRRRIAEFDSALCHPSYRYEYTKGGRGTQPVPPFFTKAIVRSSGTFSQIRCRATGRSPLQNDGFQHSTTKGFSGSSGHLTGFSAIYCRIRFKLDSFLITWS